MRVQDKIAIVVGAGQTSGETIGNGRATALLLAREGATVLAVDRDLASAEETCALIAAEGGTAQPLRADITVEFGVRVNAIMPGLLDTPMAIETITEASGVDRGELRQARDAMVPLRRSMGTAWDVAYAVLYLASDEAGFVTSVVLPVDGGQQGRVG